MCWRPCPKSRASRSPSRAAATPSAAAAAPGRIHLRAPAAARCSRLRRHLAQRPQTPRARPRRDRRRVRLPPARRPLRRPALPDPRRPVLPPHRPLPSPGPPGHRPAPGRHHGVPVPRLGHPPPGSGSTRRAAPGAAAAVGRSDGQRLEGDHPSGAPALLLRLDLAGKTLAYTGDTAWTDALTEAAADADLLIAEAYYRDKNIPYTSGSPTSTPTGTSSPPGASSSPTCPPTCSTTKTPTCSADGLQRMAFSRARPNSR